MGTLHVSLGLIPYGLGPGDLGSRLLLGRLGGPHTLGEFVLGPHVQESGSARGNGGYEHPLGHAIAGFELDSPQRFPVRVPPTATLTLRDA
jgi:hypothetical protein